MYEHQKKNRCKKNNEPLIQQNNEQLTTYNLNNIFDNINLTDDIKEKIKNNIINNNITKIGYTEYMNILNIITNDKYKKKIYSNDEILNDKTFEDEVDELLMDEKIIKILINNFKKIII